ncbi:hypothetical protein WR164_09770 [Philodulcilactobacillus myokoensis]|uniref:Uncharacterized protein n=1 Tax=Philodulcilactobacillus myokoensis TaxID=2929573 RepID=A0A9W6B1N4_9LACO|nr:UPF0223 family protein [Philodulcilactobacillus myokoensis]GLB46998.1 hypothetical protein WR164_09770 [Philodulcilactobacillus myokoensis]
MIRNNYSYPIFSDWSKDELIKVVKLYRSVEDAYEINQGSRRDLILKNYQIFTKINPSKMEQKQLEHKFYLASGYNIFKTWQKARKSNQEMIKM